MTVPGARPGAPALSAGPDLKSLLKALGRRWPLALGLGLVLAMAAAAAAWYLLSPKYTAFAKVRVALFSPKMFNHSLDEGKTEFDTYKRLQMSALGSRSVLNHALKKDQVKRLKIVQEQPEPLMWLEDELKLETKENSEIVTVSLASREPEEVTTLLQAIVDSYMEIKVKKEQEDRRALMLKVQTKLNETGEQLRLDRKGLERRLKESGGADKEALQQKQQMYLSDLMEARAAYRQASGDLQKAKANLAAHQATEKNLRNLKVPQAVINKALEDDPAAKKTLEHLGQLRQLLFQQEPRYTNPNHRTLVEIRDAIAKVQRLVDERRREIAEELARQLPRRAREEYEATLTQLQAAVEPLRKQERELRRQVDALARQEHKVGTISVELKQLQEHIETEKKVFEDLDGKLAFMQLEADAGPRVTVWQDAGLQKADTKRRIMAAALGPVGVLALVCFGVGWWEFRARRIGSADEVTTGLGMRLVGAVPALPGDGIGRLVAGADTGDPYEESLLESIDAIRTLLLKDASVAATRVVMVTSAVGGEGKTTLASNLATSLARAGRKTLLIDCDLRCPAAHQLFEQTLQPGFSEVLLGEVDLIDAIRPTTALDGLWLIPAGQWDREVIQALARQGTRALFERLREEFDFIVVDSHPVLPATDSLLIGQHVDAVILSLLRDVSQAPRVHTAGQRLAELGIRVLGAVVNGLPADVYQNGPGAPAATAR